MSDPQDHDAPHEGPIKTPKQLIWTVVASFVVPIAIIVLLGRTRLGAMGLVVAVIATSAAAYVGGWDQVATLGDLGIALDSLPSFELPLLRSVPVLLLPAVSLAFVGLVLSVLVVVLGVALVRTPRRRGRR